MYSAAEFIEYYDEVQRNHLYLTAWIKYADKWFGESTKFVCRMALTSDSLLLIQPVCSQGRTSWCHKTCQGKVFPYSYQL